MNNDLKKKVGAAMKKRRELFDFTQTELSRMIGKKSPAYLAFVESGQRNISIFDFCQLCENLRIKPSKLLNSISL